MNGETSGGWTEEDSRRFIDVGRIHIPWRDEVGKTILDLLPTEPEEPFTAVEIGVGGGWLSGALLERFGAARVIGVDGSPTMLAEAERLLAAFAGRFELRPFRLEDFSWLEALPGRVRCFISSLVIHHLDGEEKRRLYRALRDRLEPGGAVLIADLVAPSSERERRFMGDRWDAEVQRQSRELSGSLEAYREFVADEWNWFRYPDPSDKPSSVPEHLAWLAEAGFEGVDVFWARAGHAVYGGYAPSG
jgi:SAM-dependent methyltransferase